MAAETFFAPAKLNLFLHVTGRRADGYHSLQSIFTMLDVGDTIHINIRNDGEIRQIGEIAGVSAAGNLAILAAKALKRATDCPLGADIGLTKITPMGAGLGGGSSDAATVLLALNLRWKLALTNAELRAIGVKLGADVPFFLLGQTAFAEGVGEVLSAINIPLWWYVVLTPNVHVSTPFVFSHPDLTRATASVKIADFSAAGIADAFLRTTNDLQAVVLKAFPAVAASLAALSEVSKKSVFGARMTGSGASVFAAFETEQLARDAFQRLSPKHTGFVAQGLVKHPMLG